MSGKNGALTWSILVGKQKHNVQKPTLDTVAVTELWRLDLFSCTSSSFLCAGTRSPSGKCCYFFAGGLVGVDKHLFQRVSFITSMTLPLNYIFVLLLANIDVIPKQKHLSTV